MDLWKRNIRSRERRTGRRCLRERRRFNMTLQTLRGGTKVEDLPEDLQRELATYLSVREAGRHARVRRRRANATGMRGKRIRRTLAPTTVPASVHRMTALRKAGTYPVIYVAGGTGQDDVAVATMACYHPRVHKWVNKHWDGKAWVPLAAMTTARSHAAYCRWNGKLVVVGGQDADDETLASVEAYDPMENRWQTLPSLPEPRSHMGACTCDGAIYVAGGFNADSGGTSEMYRFDGNAWQVMARMPTARHHVGLVAVGSSVYAAGGCNDELDSLNDVEMYNPSTDTWTTVPPMATARDCLGAVTVGQRFFVVGGCTDSGGQLDTVECYDPRATVKTPSPCTTLQPMLTARQSTSVVVGEGHLYVMGGFSQGKVLASVESYDIQGGTWTTIPPMTDARSGSAAAWL